MTRGRAGASRFLLLAAFAASTCTSPGGSPRLEVASAVIETTATGVHARFDVRNAGAGRLHVRTAVGDCGCRVALAGPDVLAPRERTAVTASCRPVPGVDADRRLRLHTNDAAGAARVLTVPVPSSGPAAIAFGYVSVGDATTRDVALPTGASARLVPASAPFSIEPAARGPNGATHRVRFAPRAAGVARAAIALGDAGTITVAGVGHGSVVSYPAELQTPSTVAAGLPPLVVRNLGAAPIEITDIEFPEGISGELQTIAAGRDFRLRLRAREGVRSGAITMHTTAVDTPRVVVPVIPRSPST